MACSVLSSFLSSPTTEGLQKRFPGQKTNWDLVVKKALKFVASWALTT
jgi:hypothetical protein